MPNTITDLTPLVAPLNFDLTPLVAPLNFDLTPLVAPLNFETDTMLKTHDLSNVQKRFELMKAVFDCIESQMLDKNPILPYVRAALTYDKELLLYLLNTIPRGENERFLRTFQEVYTEIYQNGRVYFERIVCPYENFATALLYSAYH
jgi:hypothetical protein